MIDKVFFFKSVLIGLNNFLRVLVVWVKLLVLIKIILLFFKVGFLLELMLRLKLGVILSFVIVLLGFKWIRLMLVLFVWIGLKELVVKIVWFKVELGCSWIVLFCCIFFIMLIVMEWGEKLVVVMVLNLFGDIFLVWGIVMMLLFWRIMFLFRLFLFKSF